MDVDRDRAAIRAETTLEPHALLNEWMAYWFEHDHMPAKMPHALHIRTALALTIAGHQLPEPELRQ